MTQLDELNFITLLYKTNTSHKMKFAVKNIWKKKLRAFIKTRGIESGQYRKKYNSKYHRT